MPSWSIYEVEMPLILASWISGRAIRSALSVCCHADSVSLSYASAYMLCNDAVYGECRQAAMPPAGVMTITVLWLAY